MDKRLAALIACSIGFGQIAGASPISEARIQELMASRDRQEVKLEALRSRDREILVQLGQMLSEKYGGLLEGSEMVFTRLVEQGTVYYRMDFVGLKGRDRARALCEILDVEKCIALGPHGQMTLLQTDGDLTVSAMGVVEDTRPFAVLRDEPAPEANPKARQIEERVRRMLDPLGIFPMPRPDHIADDATAEEAVETPEAPETPEGPAIVSEQVAGRSELDAMLEDGLARAPQTSLRPKARPSEETSGEITVVEYFEETNDIEEQEPELDILVEIEEPHDEGQAAPEHEVTIEIEEPTVDEMEVSIEQPVVRVQLGAPTGAEAAAQRPAPVIILPEDMSADATTAEPRDPDAAPKAVETPEEIEEDAASGQGEMADTAAVVIEIDQVASPAGPDEANAEPESDLVDEPGQESVSQTVSKSEPEIEWEKTRPAEAPAAPAEPQTRPVPAPEEASGPMMLTPDMQIEIELPAAEEGAEDVVEPTSIEQHSMMTPDAPASFQERLGAGPHAYRDIASTREAFLSGGLGTSPAGSTPKPGRTIAMRLPGLGEVDLSRLAPIAPGFSKDGTARFPEVALHPETEKPASRDVQAAPTQADAVQARPAPRITELPDALKVEDASVAPADIEVAQAPQSAPAHPAPLARAAALKKVEPPKMQLANGPQSRDAALARVMAKAETPSAVLPVSRSAALASFEEERRMAEIEAAPMPAPRDEALSDLEDLRLAQSTPEPQSRSVALTKEAASPDSLPTPEPRAIAIAEVEAPAETPKMTTPEQRVAMVPLDGGALKNGFQVNVPMDLAGMKGGYEAMDAPRLSNTPKVEVALLGTVHFDDQFAVPASLDFAHGRDAGRLQKLPDPRPDLEAVVKRQVSRAGQAAIDPEAARLALDISRGLHPGATLAQVPGLGGTASPDHGIAPPGFFEDAPEAESIEAEKSPSLMRLEDLLGSIEDEAEQPVSKPEVKAEEAPAAIENSQPLSGLDALLAATSRPKLPEISTETPSAEPVKVTEPPAAMQSATVAEVMPKEAEQSSEEIQDEKPAEQTNAQRQALEILAQIAQRAEEERKEAERATAPAAASEAPAQEAAVSTPSLAERAATPAQDRPDFDTGDLRIELSYVDSREAVKTRAKELRGFFPPVMLEKGRFFGASVPGRPGRYIVGLEARDLKSRDDLIWYMDQMGMPWAMR